MSSSDPFHSILFGYSLTGNQGKSSRRRGRVSMSVRSNKTTPQGRIESKRYVQENNSTSPSMDEPDSRKRLGRKSKRTEIFELPTRPNLRMFVNSIHDGVLFFFFFFFGGMGSLTEGLSS